LIAGPNDCQPNKPSKIKSMALKPSGRYVPPPEGQKAHKPKSNHTIIITQNKVPFDIGAESNKTDWR